MGLAMRELNLVLSFRPQRAQRLWPVLIGPTGAGKTTRVRQWAHEHGYTVKTLLLGTMLPEEILGIPRVIKGRTVWSLPEWVPVEGERAIIFLDELDKARPESLASVLTLMAELRVRDHRLPEDTLIVGAMQPVPDDWLADETARAIRARIVPIPVAYDWAYLESTYHISLKGFPSSTPSVPTLPEPSMRQVEYVLELIYTLGLTEETRRIAALVLGEKWSAIIIDRLESVQPDIMRELALRLSREPERIDRLDAQTAMAVLPYIVRHGTRAAAMRCLARIHREPMDQAVAGHDNLYQTLSRWIRESGSKIQIFEMEPDIGFREWVDFVNEAARLCAESPYWRVKDDAK